MAGSAWIEKTWRGPEGRRVRTGERPSEERKRELTAQGFKVGPPYLVVFREPGTTKKTYETFVNLDDARIRKTEIERKLQSGTYVEKVKRTQPLGKYIERMLAGSRNIAPSTARWYRQHYETHVRDTLGKRPIGDITKDELDDWFATQGFGTGTLHAVRQLLQKTFNAAARDGIRDYSPLRGITFPKRPQREVVPLDVETVEAFADAIEPRFRLAVMLAGYVGLRGGEIGGLRLQDFELRDRDGDILENPTLTVKQAVRTVGGRAEIAEPKTKASRRRVDIPRFLVEEIERHVEAFGAAEDGRLFQPERNHGGLVSHFTLDKALGKAAEALGIAKPRFHDLRHTAASFMIAQGGHPKFLQEQLGHSDISTTLGVYGHLFPTLGKEMARSLDSMRTKVLIGRKPPELVGEVVEQS